MYERPEIQHVSLGCALGVEALKRLLAHVDREGRFSVSGVAVNGTGPATLRAATAETIDQSQVVEHLFHRDLLPHEREVNKRSGARVRWRGRLDRTG